MEENLDALKIFAEIDRLASDVSDLYRAQSKNTILLFDRYASIPPNNITPRKFIADAKMPLNVTIGLINRLVDSSSKNIAKEYNSRFVSKHLVASANALTQPLFAQMSYDVMLVKSDIVRMSIEVTNREANGESKDSAFIAAKKNLHRPYADKIERRVAGNYVEIMTRNWAISSIYGAFVDQAKESGQRFISLTDGNRIDVSGYNGFMENNLSIYPNALPKENK